MALTEIKEIKASENEDLSKLTADKKRIIEIL